MSNEVRCGECSAFITHRTFDNKCCWLDSNGNAEDATHRHDPSINYTTNGGFKVNIGGIKVGDRVRLTCGESVNVVTVVSADGSEEIEATHDGSDARFIFRFNDWTVEVLSSPIPDVAGTIVRDRNDDAWQHRGHGWYMCSGDEAYDLESVQRACGPLTVLWTPSDKAHAL